jgi:hypothetical protein
VQLQVQHFLHVLPLGALVSGFMLVGVCCAVCVLFWVCAVWLHTNSLCMLSIVCATQQALSCTRVISLRLTAACMATFRVLVWRCAGACVFLPC